MQSRVVGHRPQDCGLVYEDGKDVLAGAGDVETLDYMRRRFDDREHGVLGRAQRPGEVQHFTDSARRVAAILKPVSQP